MNEEQSAGEVMVLALIDQADRFGKSAKATQQELDKQIRELAAMEARVTTAVASIHAAIKNLEGERARLQGIGPTLQQNAAWAMRESLREHSDEIETQINAGMATPLAQIKQASDHVRQNVRDTNWTMYVAMLLVGAVLGLFVGYLPMRSSVKALEEHVNQIDQHLAAQQSQPAMTPAPAPQQQDKKHGRH